MDYEIIVVDNGSEENIQIYKYTNNYGNLYGLTICKLIFFAMTNGYAVTYIYIVTYEL